MTAEERTGLRHLIDQSRRAQITADLAEIDELGARLEARREARRVREEYRRLRGLCVACGVERGKWTRGCKVCSKRHWWRRTKNQSRRHVGSVAPAAPTKGA